MEQNTAQHLSISAMLATDAKKAGGASEYTCLTHRPVYFTGRLACIHCISEISFLLVELTTDQILQMLGFNASNIVINNIIT
jgi:hypothetical protein